MIPNSQGSVLAGARPRRLAESAVRFGRADIDAAREQWRCTCGPIAIACILDLMPDDVRPIVGGGYRGFMNPTDMVSALGRAGVIVTEFDRNRIYRPEGPRQYGCPFVATYGVTRIQFAGPWTEEGANPCAAYHHTHWVASRSDEDGFPDIHDNNWGWMGIAEFFRNMDELAKEIKGSSGAWWPTHIYEITFPGETGVRA